LPNGIAAARAPQRDRARRTLTATRMTPEKTDVAAVICDGRLDDA
jgi:hypothetical protein